ncbi:MAG: hypothetical protein LBR90_04380 [Elusimicrobiota bacterium]|jgi:hypothetical protein|nr:hypothetical protein [Elusimicrobiota bacterium]
MRAIYIILIGGLFLLFISMERVQRQKTGHRVAALMEDIEFKKARNQYLRYRLGVYNSPDKIVNAALEDKMIVTEPRNIVVLEGQSAGQRQD